ncbi:MAG: hypothetical protein U1F66_04465 [bacterium]
MIGICVLAACSAPDAERSSTQGLAPPPAVEQGLGTARVPEGAGGEATPLPSPELTATPGPSSATPAPTPGGSGTGPTSPPSGPAQPPAATGSPGFGGPYTVNETGPLRPERTVTANQTGPALQSLDQTLPLQEVYAISPLEYVTPQGRRLSFDPLANIQVVAGSGTIRFVRPSPLLANQPTFVELGFEVRYPTRIRYNPQTGYYDTFFPTDWLNFQLLACGADHRCRVLAAQIPNAAEPGSCTDLLGSCVLKFQIRQNVSRFDEYYRVTVEGSAAADYQDEQGNARLCSDSLQDCTMSHPYCVAGVCSAVSRGADYFRAEAP